MREEFNMKLKKFIMKLLICIIVATPFTNNIYANNIYFNKKISKQVNLKDQSVSINSIIVLPKEKYNKDEASKMMDRLSKIPSSIIYKLYDSDVKIKLVNGPITNEPEYANLKGVTPRGWEGTNKTWDDVPGAGGKTVVIRIGYSERGKGHSSINLELHEAGHAVDQYAFNNISQDDNFKKIWKNEVDKLFPQNAYFENYSEEYFAETFAMFYIDKANNEKLKNEAPLTYEFIKNLSK